MNTKNNTNNYELEARDNFLMEDFSKLLQDWDGELATLANEAFVLGYTRAMQNHMK